LTDAELGKPRGAKGEAPATSQRSRIVRDEGTASSGGASSTQKVVVSRPDGTEYPAHAKFAKDVNGAVLAENGEHGLASELLTSVLGRLLGAPVPLVEVVEVPPDLPLRLRGDRRPAPGLAVASQTISAWTDVNAPDALADVPAEEVAAIAVLHAWAEVGDRGHNMIRSGTRVYSIDHATAFGSAWNALDPPGTFAPDAILSPVLQANPEALVDAGRRLARVTDKELDEAVSTLPETFVPSDEIRARIKRNLKMSRDAVSQAIEKAYAPTKEKS
jgi:HipA-like kinase